MPSPFVDILVPSYNEAATVGEVVRVLRASPKTNRVLVISDGSTDDTVSIARAAGAEVIDLGENHGKGGAVAAGMREVTSDIVGFFDADLKGLTVEHVNALVEPVLAGEVDMCIGLRDRGEPWNSLSRLLPPVSGERVLRRKIFEAIPESALQGFRLEIALYRSARRLKKPMRLVLLPGLSIRRKIEKVGLLRGLAQYLRMTGQVLSAFFSRFL